MENSLRIVLLLVGFFIVMGIAWDVWRARRRPAKQLQKNSVHSTSNRVTRKFKIEPEFEYGNSQKDSHAYENKGVQEERAGDDQDVLMQAHSAAVVTDLGRTKTFQKSVRVSSQENSEKTLENFVILNLFARQPGVFLGKKLLEAFKSLDLHLGEREIFHRHSHADGTGNIVFSIASAFEPGCFPIDKLEHFSTPGICLFFQLDDQKNQNIAAFELMLRTAKQLQKVLDGELKDENRKILTVQRIDAYRQQVRDIS